MRRRIVDQHPTALRLLFPLTLALLLGGCAVGPDYERPELTLPTEWPDEISAGLTESDVSRIEWWQRFHDPVLERLIREAMINSLDIELAATRVQQARALSGLRDAERYPTVSAFAELERDDPGLTGGGVGTDIVLAGSLEYELDLWGRLSRSAESARAELLGTAYARDAMQLAVIGDVVTAYFSYRALEEQIQITERTIESRRESLEVEQSRFDRGASTELAMRQAEAELQTSLAELPSLEAEAQRQRRVLAVLVGDSEAVVSGARELGDAGLPTLPEVMTDLPSVLPSELLDRRPDIRAAEAYLIAANADIGAARAAWLPRVDLLGVLGTGAGSPSDLFTGPATLWELAGAVTMPILDFGRRQASVAGAEAQRDIAELQYRATILTAFQEVGDAWTQLTTAEHRLQARDQEVQARIQVVDLAERRYAGGYAPYLEVLDARRALFDAELSRTAAARDRLLAAADLYKSLGGGWQEAEEQEQLRQRWADG